MIYVDDCADCCFTFEVLRTTAELMYFTNRAVRWCLTYFEFQKIEMYHSAIIYQPILSLD